MIPPPLALVSLGTTDQDIVCDGSKGTWFEVTLSGDINATFSNMKPGLVYGFIVQPSGHVFRVNGANANVTTKTALAFAANSATVALAINPQTPPA